MACTRSWVANAFLHGVSTPSCTYPTAYKMAPWTEVTGKNPVNWWARDGHAVGFRRFCYGFYEHYIIMHGHYKKRFLASAFDFRDPYTTCSQNITQFHSYSPSPTHSLNKFDSPNEGEDFECVCLPHRDFWGQTIRLSSLGDIHVKFYHLIYYSDK